MLKSKPLISLVVSSIAILSIAGIIFAFAGGPPVGATGSVIFNQQSCAQAGCHAGMAVNSSAGSLTLTGVPANYTLGQSYDLSITINQPNQRRWGFQISARCPNEHCFSWRLSVVGRIQPASNPLRNSVFCPQHGRDACRHRRPSEFSSSLDGACK